MPRSPREIPRCRRARDDGRPHGDRERAGHADPAIGARPVGDGLRIGRDSGSPGSLDHAAPFRFTGGVIEKVIVDVSGEHYEDHEKEVAAWLMKD